MKQFSTTMALLSPKLSKTEDNVKVTPGATKQGRVYLHFEAENFNGYLYLPVDLVDKLKEVKDAAYGIHMP